MVRIRNIIRLFLFFFVLSAACPALAQTSKGDQLFAEGQALQKKRQYSKAIAKYKAAKVAYTSAEKKQMCDDQINLCKPGPVQVSKEKEEKNKNKDSLVISAKHLSFEYDKENTAEVSVLTGDSSWTFDASTLLYGDSAFVSVKKTTDGKGLRIQTDMNNRTLSRHQHIFVSSKECNDTIYVEQSGKNVTLRTSENLLDYKLKGGSKNIYVITNSDSIIANNNKECWYVESKPDWIEVNSEVVTQSTLAKFKKYLKSSKPILADDEKSSAITITVVPLLKSDVEYTTGRKGEVIIASQSKRYKVIVIQQN